MKKLFLSILCFFIFSYAHAANDKAFFWQVSSDATTVYLLGSIHFADKSFYPLRQEIEDAFNRSKYLVVELDTSQIDSDTYNQLVSQKGTYKKGKTIKDVVSKETWLRLRQQLQQLNIDYDNVKNLKPGMLVLTLSAIQAVQMGLNPQLGIDNHFLLKAVESPGKQIIELETLQQQISLFLNIPNAELLLQESLYSLDEAEMLMSELVRYWKQGDELKMNKLLFEDAIVQYPAFAEIYDRLFYQRNQQMTEKID
ncbi:MAG: TraB/GumN family protein, partial [Gammaproteobacteria bacterium]|nr:TraB/GumN family protein [Gammaproteobacteria bacterium]